MPGTYQYDVEIKSNVAKLLSDMKQVQDRLDTVEGKEYKIKLNVDEKKLSSVISNLEKMLNSLGKGTGDFKQFENLSKQLSSITIDIGKISKAFATMDDGLGLVNNIKSIDSSLTSLTNHFVLQVSDKMASSIKEVKGTLSDVGDGKELTPLLNTIERIEFAIDKLSSSVKGIGLNMNIDFGSDTEMEAKVQAKISNALQAYQRLFEHIKMSSAGGSIINTKFFDFDINQYDTAMSKLQAYKKFIENMRNEAKSQFKGKDVLYNGSDKKYWTQASSAMGQVTKVFNEMKASTNTNPLENIFGKTDLTEVIEQLNTIVSKLDEISVSAKGFAETFKNGLNVNASVEEIEKLTNRVKKLESELAKIKTPTTVATPQESNISSASTESVTNSIKEENNVLEQNTQKIKENTQAKEQNANVNLNKYDKRLDSYNGKVDKYQATIDRFNDGGWTSKTYLENVQAVKNAVHEYETLLNELKGKDASLVTSDDINRLDNYEKKIKDTIATVTNMSASEKGYNFVSGQKELDKIHKLLNENSKMSSEAKAKIKAYYAEIESGNPSMSLDKIHGEILKIYNAEVEAGRAGRTLFDTLKNSGFHQIAAQMAGMVGVYDVINVIKQAASTVTELNTQITELAKVSEQSSKQIYADFDSYADIAKEVRGTISDTIAATADWSKNGYSIPDAKQLAEISQLYKNVGDGIDIDTANESLISTLKGFQLEADQAEHIVDVFNEVSNNEAISSGGIGEALQRSAASFNAASTSLEKSVSLVTATNSVLQNPEKVGNMWRTVSARLRGSETELKEMGEDTDGLVTSTSKLQALVKGITGFDIMKDKDTYKDIYDIVLGIGEKWKDLSDIDRASLLEALAGKQQSNALAAALSNIDILKKSYEEATHAEGSAREENEEYSKSIRASIDLAQAKLEQLANDTLNSNFLKGAIDAGGKLIEVLDGIVKSGNAIPTLLAAIGAGLSFKNIGKCYVSA